MPAGWAHANDPGYLPRARPGDIPSGKGLSWPRRTTPSDTGSPPARERGTTGQPGSPPAPPSAPAGRRSSSTTRMIEATSATVRNLTSLSGVSPAAICFPSSARSRVRLAGFSASVTSVPSVSLVWKRATPARDALWVTGPGKPVSGKDGAAGGHDGPVDGIARVQAGLKRGEIRGAAVGHLPGGGTPVRAWVYSCQEPGVAAPGPAGAPPRSRAGGSRSAARPGPARIRRRRAAASGRPPPRARARAAPGGRPAARRRSAPGGPAGRAGACRSRAG